MIWFFAGARPGDLLRMLFVMLGLPATSTTSIARIAGLFGKAVFTHDHRPAILDRHVVSEAPQREVAYSQRRAPGNYGYPEVYGNTLTGHCGHCGGRPEHCVRSAYGDFCMACCKWRTYTGPKQVWGDGMHVTQELAVQTDIHSERVKGRWPLCWSKFTMGARYTCTPYDDRVTCEHCLEIMNG